MSTDDPMSLCDYMRYRREAGSKRRLLRADMTWPEAELEAFHVFSTDRPEQVLTVIVTRAADGEQVAAEIATPGEALLAVEEDVLFERDGWRMLDSWAWEHESLTGDLRDVVDKAAAAADRAEVLRLVRELAATVEAARPTLTEDRDGFYDECGQPAALPTDG